MQPLVQHLVPSRTCALICCALISSLGGAAARAADPDVFDRVEHGYADNQGVRIHYASLGSGPLVVMIHGFPDFWYSWRHQMAALADRYRTVAIDQRGYNLSDQPTGVESYDVALLVADVAAVIRQLGAPRATVVGHDWGGFVAWNFAMRHPELLERLVILNLPHPTGITRELATNLEQAQNSQYARNFQQDGAHQGMTAEALARWVQDPAAKARYVEAFARSDFESMLNYYKRNYPREPYEANWRAWQASPPPRITAPVLVFHGLEDRALHRRGLNQTWEWLDSDLTLVTVPGAGHFVQQDAADLVSRTLRWWLEMRR